MTPAKISPQSSNRISYLGPSGTFTEQALLSQEDLQDFEPTPEARFVDVLQTVAGGEARYGFVAIENAIEGTVNVTLDSLALDHSLLIQREVELDIHFQLLVQPGVTLSEIKTVMSHPVAIAQCRKFIDQELPQAKIRPSNSTADAANYVLEDRTVAAVGSQILSELKGLEVLAKDIADHAGNQTRFVLVATSGIPAPTGYDKTTVVLTEREDKPGSLVSMLQEFAARNINLTRLTSRPLKSQLGQYCFIVDFVGHIADDVVADCLRSVMAKHADVKFLGSYATVGNGSEQNRSDASERWSNATSWVDELREQIS